MAPTDTAPDVARFGALSGASAAMRELFALLARAARSAAIVLLEGETGTGKELAAEALHAASARAAGPFVVCDLAGVARTLIESELFGHVRGAFTGAAEARDGAFAQAAGGTLFIDEVAELELAAQPRLLRALERRQVKPVGGGAYREVDVRVVAATNRDLAAEVAAGRFRGDLYHRLAVVRVRIPPLRERMDDLPILVEELLARTAPGVAPSAAAVARLAAHDWPGNVRELRNVLERAASVLPDGVTTIAPEHLGLDAPGPLDQPAAGPLTFHAEKERIVAAWERTYLARLLAGADGNVARAARDGGLDRAHLHRLLKKHGFDQSRPSR